MKSLNQFTVEDIRKNYPNNSKHFQPVGLNGKVDHGDAFNELIKKVT